MSFSELRESLNKNSLTVAEVYSGGTKAKALATTGNAEVEAQRVAVAGSLTIDFLSKAVACAIVQEGLLPVVYEAPFGAYMQEALDPSSGLHKFRPDLVVLAPDWRELTDPSLFDVDEANVATVIAQKVRELEQIWSALEERGARIIQHTLVPPANIFRGVADRLSPGSLESQVVALNAKLMRAGEGRVSWVEVDRLASFIGQRNWSSDRFFFTSKLAFDLQNIGDYLAWFRGAWRATFGKTKKVLILDLDNTLWGGVVGDDGVDGLRLGPEHGAEGEAFFAWQTYVKALSQRGVILAVCSKNDPRTAASGFDHPYSILKRDDFAAFECSWEDKASGIRRITVDLNLGADSVVFVDDNPAETALVRREIPEVVTVDLGDDPTSYRERLDAGHWFDLMAYSREDTTRQEAYIARRLATNSREEATDMSAYLTSLSMVGRVFRPEPRDIKRLAQLEMKTNQFNLTTRRYSQVDIERIMADPNALVLALRLKDRFGDHGLTSTLIGFFDGQEFRINSWLMSCRIFSRTAEQFMLLHTVRAVQEKGTVSITGEYRPSDRNAVVTDLYGRLGFDDVSGNGRLWCRLVTRPLDDLTNFIVGEN